MTDEELWAGFDIQAWAEEALPNTCDNIYCGVEIPYRWYAVVLAALVIIENDTLELPAKVSIAQVKEKFGGLRIYYDVEPQEMYPAVERVVEPAIEVAESLISAIEAYRRQGQPT